MRWDQKEELREEISLLRDIIEFKNKKRIPRHQILKSVENIKKRIREKLKRYNERENNIHYSEDGENCWYKEWYDCTFTKEDKREFIKNNWMHINSSYDCTGKWFTQDILIHNVETSFGAKSVVYHFMGLDV